MKPGDPLVDYVLTASLGQDGPTRTMLAQPPERLGLGDTQVVVKLLPGGDDRAFRAFTRELKLYARVRHPALLTLFDAGQHEDLFFYSTEFCAGGSLAKLESTSRPVTMRALEHAAHAVHHLHETGVVHRDIRPATILLRSDGSAALADLAVAQSASSTVTSMAPTASIGFIDPQLLLGAPASRATDLYALGATLHWLLTRQHLFPKLDGGDLLLAVRTVLSGSPTVRRDVLSPAEADLITACLDRRIEARPTTAAEFAVLVGELAGPRERSTP
jgi:serine/threonine protein kinase